MSEEKEALLQELDKSACDRADYYKQSIHGGLRGKVRILLRYPHKLILNKWFRLRLKKEKLVETTLFYGRKFYTDSERMYSFGYMPSEVNLTKFFIKHLRPDDVLYDVGANCGFYTFLADKFITEGEIHCFEPSPEPVVRLKKGVKDNTCLTFVHEVAVSDQNGEVSLWDGYNDSATGASTMVKEALQEKEGEGGYTFEKTTVKSITLDEYVKDHTPPTFIKVDVEGAEEFVVDGATQLLTSHNLYISLEVWTHSPERYKISQRAVKKIMDLGYVPYEIDMDGEPHKLADLSFEAVKKDRYDNWLFKKG